MHGCLDDKTLNFPLIKKYNIKYNVYKKDVSAKSNINESKIDTYVLWKKSKQLWI